MSHYDCNRCGTYMCRGECKEVDPEEEAKRLRDKELDDAEFLLHKERVRLDKLTDARRLLIEEGTYDYDKYEGIFDK